MSKESEIMREHIKGHRIFLSMFNEPEDVFDTILNRLLDDFDNKEQRIAELEEQLANSIRPKFKIGQEVYKVYTKIQRYPFKVKIIGFKITKTRGEDNIYYDTEEDGFEMGWYTDEILFTTKEEAEEKLKELKGE